MRGQGQKLRGPHARGAAAKRSYPHIRGQGQHPRKPGYNSTGTAKRSYPMSEVRDGSREKLPYARGQGRRAEMSNPTSKE